MPTDLLHALGLSSPLPPFGIGATSGEPKGVKAAKITPIDGVLVGEFHSIEKSDFLHVVQEAQNAFDIWRQVPAPLRGDIVRQIGQKFRENKDLLGRLITLETGKILQEGLGEVQEMVDICDYASGLSRSIGGLNLPSERVGHRLVEQYHPLGIVGVISAFNFPMAVWSWNAMIAAVTGNVVLWKPSEKAPFCAWAIQKMVADVLVANKLPNGIFSVVLGNAEVGQWISENEHISLVSATGSTAMGKKVAETVSKRLGKTILELGGNNALIVSEHADIEMALKAAVFGAVGTAGQRCTTTRRLIIHQKWFNIFKEKLISAYKKLPIGDPREEGTLVGPLIDKNAVAAYFKAIEEAETSGGKLLYGGNLAFPGQAGKGNYVLPAIVETLPSNPNVQRETFAPILYIMSYDGELKNAIDIQNRVPQGLSSALFTENMREMEQFISSLGSDCGLANINTGTSGAEIGGAFGGEKETGGGRESGSDVWKQYMRRMTSVVNASGNLPLAQGILFEI